MGLEDWPVLNASLNAASAVFVLTGLAAVKLKQIAVHRFCMATACVITAAFFVSYLSYHARVGSVPFLGVGPIRTVYFTILISHTALAITIVPLIIRTVYLALHNRLEAHKRLARWTAPLWLYVSTTGIVVFWMLYMLD